MAIRDLAITSVYAEQVERIERLIVAVAGHGTRLRRLTKLPRCIPLLDLFIRARDFLAKWNYRIDVKRLLVRRNNATGVFGTLRVSIVVEVHALGTQSQGLIRRGCAVWKLEWTRVDRLLQYQRLAPFGNRLVGAADCSKKETSVSLTDNDGLWMGLTSPSLGTAESCSADSKFP